jgi:hypothetical protein
MADGDVAAGDTGVALGDGVAPAVGLAVTELPEPCCADTTAEPQPAAASSTAASASTGTADDRPRIPGLHSNKGTTPP